MKITPHNDTPRTTKLRTAVRAGSVASVADVVNEKLGPDHIVRPASRGAGFLGGHVEGTGI